MAEEYFDRRSFGGWLRWLRKLNATDENGFSSGQGFVKALEEKAGFVISDRTYLDVERGKSEASLGLIVAVSITVFGKVLAPEIVHAIKMAVSPNLAARAAFPELFEGLERDKWKSAPVVKQGSLSDGFYKVALIDTDKGTMTELRSIDLT